MHRLLNIYHLSNNYDRLQAFNSIFNAYISIAETFNNAIRSIAYNDNYIAIGCNDLPWVYIYKRNHLNYEQEFLHIHECVGSTYIPGLSFYKNSSFLIINHRNNNTDGSKTKIINAENNTKISEIALEDAHYVGDIDRASINLPYFITITGGREGLIVIKMNDDGSHSKILHFNRVNSTFTQKVDSSVLCNNYLYAQKHDTYTYHQFIIDFETDTVTQVEDRNLSYRLAGMTFVKKHNMYVILTYKGIDFIRIENNTVTVLKSSNCILDKYPNAFVNKKPIINSELNLVYFCINNGDGYKYTVCDIDFVKMEISNFRTLSNNASYRNTIYHDNDKIFLEDGVNLYY